MNNLPQSPNDDLEAERIKAEDEIQEVNPDRHSKITGEQIAKGIVIYIMVVVTGLAITSLVVVLNLRSDLIATCIDSRTPLQERFVFELKEANARSIKDLQEAFPQFPPDQIRDSILGERENLTNLVATYDPDACDSKY